MYEVLRTDAESLNSRLWRWGNGLREQLVVMEKELARVRRASMPQDGEEAVDELLAQKEMYLRSADDRMEQLAAALQEAHNLLFNRGSQIAVLQDVLVQLSEQVSLFECIVIRCEVLSSGLVKQAALA
ncbi:hypothetical protein GPECTOR_15g527 [Gonium pectorale]|uniref:Uncharacterized protein n=1 Tax=Gonium pectorale TaxID=33097 RepID=A0A150GM25_GONPE|nr:hypothetical protein GPECTOR_15g527 [Gonium pectorale]|eukprot:KXZ50841.1 hypothetical protein GPECTOR_15g527 [Gonium pectorale]